jgi:hypothetical protein
MGMTQVVEIAHSEKKVFTLEEARALLPVIKKITAGTAEKVEKLLQKLESVSMDETQLIAETEAEANALILKWHEKMSRLGVRGKGLWYVDFDNGQDYFCWSYPEDDLFFRHAYEDGFTGRTPIDTSRPLPKELKERHGHHQEKETQWSQNRSRSDQLTPWRL